MSRLPHKLSTNDFQYQSAWAVDATAYLKDDSASDSRRVRQVCVHRRGKKDFRLRLPDVIERSRYHRPMMQRLLFVNGYRGIWLRRPWGRPALASKRLQR